MSIETIDPDVVQNQHLPVRHYRPGTDLLVPPSMLVVAGAVGMAAHLHFGVMAELAAAMALSMFCLMLLAHVLLRRGEAVARAEPRQRSTAALAAATEPGRRAAPAMTAKAAPEAGTSPAVRPGAIHAAARTASDAGMASGTASGTGRAEGPAAANIVATASPTDAAQPVAPAMTPSGVARAASEASSPLPTSAAFASETEPQIAAQPEPEPEPKAEAIPGLMAAAAGWDFRPQSALEPGFTPLVPKPTHDLLAGVRPSSKAAGRIVQTAAADLADEEERVKVILKRLASQIRGEMPEHLDSGSWKQGDAGEPEAPAARTATAAGALFQEVGANVTPPSLGTAALGTAALGTAAVSPAIADTAPADTAPADTGGDSSLASAVNALKSTVEAMRSGASLRPNAAVADTTGPARLVPPRLPGAAGTQDEEELPAASQAELRLAAVAEALAAERAEVCLEPILALAEDMARHFEVSVRLKTPDGETLDGRRIIAAAKGGPARAAGSSLLPLLDAVGVRHSAGFALKLERRGRDGRVFSEVAGESLQSQRFLSGIAGRHSQGIADRLVLTFAQDEVQGLGPAQLQALGELSRLGFRFALQGVAHLDMDFELLRASGFEFVKLDADIFLQGLRLGEAKVSPDDLCRHFAGLGMAIIVGRIEDEALRARILGFGVVFGQGALFGAPRPIPVAAPVSREAHAGV